MVNNHGDRKSPKDRVGLIVNGRTLWLINGGDPITTEASPGMILQVATTQKNCSEFYLNA